MEACEGERAVVLRLADWRFRQRTGWNPFISLLQDTPRIARFFHRRLLSLPYYITEGFCRGGGREGVRWVVTGEGGEGKGREEQGGRPEVGGAEGCCLPKVA
ncbi:hypothetical protein Ancab_034463 [Ancistrocladus abbreviatus]